MSAVCNCPNPKIKATEAGHKYCDVCGYWWEPKYGSNEDGLKVNPVGANWLNRFKKQPTK